MRFEFIVDKERKVAYLHIPDATLTEIVQKYLGKHPRRKISEAIAMVFADALNEVGKMAGYDLEEFTPVILDDGSWSRLAS